MNTKKYLVSTLLASTLIFGASGFVPAHGAERMLNPQGSWSMTKVDRTSEGGNSYCALSRKYDDDIILSLGRNAAEEYSLSIDFQKDVFDKDKSVKISLQPGPGKMRSYNLLPVSDKAVVVRLGWDNAFFDTLNTSQKMDVKLDDKSYVFSLPLIAKGQADLEDCMDGIKAAAKGPGPAHIEPSHDVLSAAPIQSNKEFDATRMREQTEVAKANVEAQEKNIVRSFVNSMQAQEDATAKKNSFGKTAPAKTDAQAKVKKPDAKQAQTAQMEPMDLRPNVLTNVEPSAGDVVASAASATASATNAALEKATTQNTQLQKRIADLSMENAALQAKIGTAAENNAQVADFEKRLSDISAKHAELALKKAEVDGQLADIAAENEALKAKIAQPVVPASLPTDTAKITSLEKQVSELIAQNTNLSVKTGEVDNRITALTAENEALKAKIAQPVVPASLPADTAKIAELEKRLMDMSAQNSTLASKTGEVDAKLVTLAAENAALKSQLAAPQTSLPTDLTRIAELEKQVTAYKVQAAAPATITALPEDSERLKELQKQVSTLTAENTNLKAQASAPQTSLPADAAKIAELEKRITDMTAVNAELIATASKAPAMNAEDAAKMAALQKTVADLTAENASLKQSVAAAGNLDAQQNKIAELETTNKSLQARLDAVALQKAQQPDAADLVNAQEEVKTLQAKNKQLEDSLRQAQNKIAEAAVGVESQSLKKIAELELKLDASQKDNLSLSKEVDDLRNKRDDGRVTLAAGNWDLEQATRRFNEAERENKRMGRELEQARMACNVEKAKIEQMLFDPAVADQKQIEKLTALEEELELAKAQLASRGLSTASVPVPSVEVASAVAPSNWQAERARLQARIKALENDDKFTGISPLPDESAKVKEMERQNASLRMEMDNLRAQLGNATSNRVATATQEADRMKREKALVTDKVSSAAKLASVEPAAGNSAMDTGAGIGIHDASSLKSLLQKAGVSTGGVKKASSGMAGAQNFSWSGKSGISGSSSVKPMKSSAEFDGLVKEYIASRKAECGGDFASIPTSEASGGKKVALYETACVGGSKSGASSTLFFVDQGRFVAISSEAGTDNMDDAMDSRDKIASAVGNL
jgi:chromosome segregation ATPase